MSRRRKKSRGNPAKASTALGTWEPWVYQLRGRDGEEIHLQSLAAGTPIVGADLREAWQAATNVECLDCNALTVVYASFDGYRLGAWHDSSCPAWNARRDPFSRDLQLMKALPHKETTTALSPTVKFVFLDQEAEKRWRMEYRLMSVNDALLDVDRTCSCRITFNVHGDGSEHVYIVHETNCETEASVTPVAYFGSGPASVTPEKWVEPKRYADLDVLNEAVPFEKESAS